MDRFRWCSDQVEYRGFPGTTDVAEESLVLQQSGVRLYEGPVRSAFDDGVVMLTTHRLIWTQHQNSLESFLALPLAAVLDVKFEEGGGIIRSRTPKVVLRLLSSPALTNALASLPHPLPWMNRWLPDATAHVVVENSNENHIKLGFMQTGDREFLRAIEEVIKAKLWSVSIVPATSSNRAVGRVGIGSIQRQQAAKAGVADAQLEEAFDDLNKLISRASEMVTLSRSLASRTRDAKGGDLSIDETTELRSAMLSMGITEDDTGPRSSRHHSAQSSSFHGQLAHQISQLFTPMLTKKTDTYHVGAGCIDLASAYCRINRARGMQLISPEDLLQACHLLEREKLPLRLKTFPGGLRVLQLASENERETLEATASLVKERSSMTPDELARATNLSALLARERLLAVEHLGLVCRDDSEEGLRFYPNLFATNT